MRLIHVACCVAVAAAPALACSNETKEASTQAALSQERANASVQDRARSLLLASKVQLQDLRTNRDELTDPHQRDAVASQIIELTMSRDRLMGDLAGAGTDARAIERDMSNLQRAMRGAGAAEAQPRSEPRPPPAPAPQPPAAPQAAPAPQPAPVPQTQPAPQTQPVPQPQPAEPPER